MAIAKYPKTCATNVAGNSMVGFANVGDIDAITIASGEITAITAATDFKEYDAELDSIQYTWEAKAGASGWVTNKLICNFGKLTNTLITAIEAIEAQVACGVQACWLDNNGTGWLGGYSEDEEDTRSMRIAESTFDSGKKPSDEDMQQVILTLTWESKTRALPFDSTISGTLTDGTAAFVDWN
jgi:hypothetical protein